MRITGESIEENRRPNTAEGQTITIQSTKSRTLNLYISNLEGELFTQYRPRQVGDIAQHPVKKKMDGEGFVGFSILPVSVNLPKTRKKRTVQ